MNTPSNIDYPVFYKKEFIGCLSTPRNQLVKTIGGIKKMQQKKSRYVNKTMAWAWVTVILLTALFWGAIYAILKYL